MLHFVIFIDGLELEQLRADGVIFATPTGSTAYAMSAGGPLVDPKVDATIIVPIAPFKLSARPTVVDIQSEIGFALLEIKNAELVIDGQFYRSIGKGERISITRGEPAFFVRIWDKHFLKLRDKLRIEEGK
jgi:NAD+ kinase